MLLKKLSVMPAGHSQNLNPNIWSIQLEFHGLKLAITDQFHEYLCGNTFDIYTDNNPITYFRSTAKLDETGHRWIAGLANYNFYVHYVSLGRVM